MRENKRVLIFSGIVILICVALLWGVEIDALRAIDVFLEKHQELFINIILGVFTSMLVTFAISWISYNTIKIDTLNRYWLEREKYLQKVNLLGMKYFNQGTSLGDSINKLKENYEALHEINQLQDIYCDLCIIKSEIHMIGKKAKLAKIVEEIEELAGQVNCELTNISSIILKLCADEIALQYIYTINCDNSNIDKLVQANKKLQDTQGIKTTSNK